MLDSGHTNPQGGEQARWLAEEMERTLQSRVADAEMFDAETLAGAAPVAERVFNARVMRAVETALGGYSSGMPGGSARAGGRLRELLVNEMGFCVEEVRCSRGRERAYIRYGCLPGMERRTEAFVDSKCVARAPAPRPPGP